MRLEVSLYRYETSDIKVTIDAYFEGEVLVIDGYDIGKRVEEFWGDSDYEYIIKIPKAGVEFLFSYLQIESGNRKKLLLALAARYNSNSCYSDICKLMEDNKIKCEGFTWV